jgi:hypothetical protein
VEKNLRSPAFYLNEAGFFYFGAGNSTFKNNSENSDSCRHPSEVKNGLGKVEEIFHFSQFISTFSESYKISNIQKHCKSNRLSPD